MEWKLKWFDEMTTQEVYKILQLRTEVFVVEQQCPYLEVDGKDMECYHLWGEENGEIAAYLRILPAGVSYEEVSIGRVLVKKDFRGQQLGRVIMEKAMRIIEDELKETMIKIQAQSYLREFYGSLGFQAISDEYLDDNIPHIDMLRIKSE